MNTFEAIYSTVRDNLPLNIRVNISTTFHNNTFSTAVGYVSTKMGRDDIRDVKKPYATTNIYNAAANPPVIPVYTNPCEISKLLQLQQWPNCMRVGGACHQPHILCKPDMVIVLNEIQFRAPAQPQVAGQAPPGAPAGASPAPPSAPAAAGPAPPSPPAAASPAPPGPPAGGTLPPAVPTTSG